ncbi:MAG: hypothetical protein ACI88G_000733 [Woeseiaceae bacterium]|jgi:hypothetical protein
MLNKKLLIASEENPIEFAVFPKQLENTVVIRMFGDGINIVLEE